jgi:hypothetical protein
MLSQFKGCVYAKPEQADNKDACFCFCKKTCCYKAETKGVNKIRKKNLLFSRIPGVDSSEGLILERFLL